ncbi:MAG: DNA polymerase IV [Planctomycetes bacterium]|nr:DNA polymerase IV [Planctomycetota bacterium]
MPPTGERSILHVDMDAFFAAVEVLDAPRLAGRPVIVGGTPEGRGVVATASYEARAFGVRSAMPAAQAVRLCPQGVFLRPRMGRYLDASERVFAVLRDVTPLVEPLSIDEAFLDVTGCPGPAEHLARELRSRIERATGGLTCSIGVAENKFLAKVASDLEKPRGLVVVPRGRGAAFLAPLPIEKLWGVGPKTAARLRELGLDAIGQVARTPERDLEMILGRELGRHLHRLSHGADDRPVVTDWEARSVSQETTFAEFIPPGDLERIEREIFDLSEGVALRLRQEGLWGRTVKLKARDDQFRTCTRALTLGAPTQLVEEISAAAVGLFRERVRFGAHAVRLLGVGVAGLTREPMRQLELFGADAGARERLERLARAEDAVRERLGDGAITRGRLVERRRERRRR